jgi:hypothetical protein
MHLLSLVAPTVEEVRHGMGEFCPACPRCDPSPLIVPQANTCPDALAASLTLGKWEAISARREM